MCKGCLKSGFCDLQMNGTTGDCPCDICIVKPVCDVKICEDMNEFYKKRFGFEHEDFKNG